MSSWTPDAGLCVPVLDERDSLGPLLGEIAAALEGARYTVCLVDDGSTDGTAELVRAAAERDPRIVLLQRPRGGPGCRRGGASRAGLEWLLSHTGHRVFVDLDADGANDPGELAAGIRQVDAGGADVAIASKYVAGSRVAGRPLLRRLGSRLYSGLLRLLMGSAVRDFSNSYRFYSRAAAELLLRVPPRYEGPVYLAEMLAVWLSAGLRVVELPPVYGARRGGASKVTLGDAVAGFAGAVHVGWLYRRGFYRAAPLRG
ncbi:MAG: glycosyltransferase [Elusimicrobia bacterium]|nr:glycosyltransferase [Elusimicrobiota bacterium]